MTSQPKQFSHEHSSIFQDASVVAAYPYRPPYPVELFTMLAELLDKTNSPCCILDAGCGTGQMTQGLLPYVDSVDAVDISAAMIEAGKRMPYGSDPKIHWVAGAIESVPLQPPYALIVAAASLHWMPWGLTLPRFAHGLSSNGYLALVEEVHPANLWDAALTPLIIKYSTNRDFQSYNMLTVAAELEQRGVFQQVGVKETALVPFGQPLAHWIEAIHARNGFSRERMGTERAREFDQQVQAVMRRFFPDGEVVQQIGARIVYGKPLAPQEIG
ncbi:MAG: class I SAM-dependent methyltransferase [Caldilineaceae bacterium]